MTMFCPSRYPGGDARTRAPPGSWHRPSAVRVWRFWLDDRITRLESLRCSLRSSLGPRTEHAREPGARARSSYAVAFLASSLALLGGRLSHADPLMRRSAGSWLTFRVVVMPVPSTRGPHPSPRALGRVIGPRPSRNAVEPLLGMPRRRAAELLVAASKHAAFVLPLPMLL